MGLAIVNYESTRGFYPRGGTQPWPYIIFQNGTPKDPPTERYLWRPLDCDPNRPETCDQDAGWAYFILPYMEFQQVYLHPEHEQIQEVGIPYYFCPSRRSAATAVDGNGNDVSGGYLMDYAAAHPGISNDREDPVTYFWWLFDVRFPDDGPGTRQWDTFLRFMKGEDFYRGVITRTCFNRAISSRDITDGLTHTFVVGEKWLDPTGYYEGRWYDDRGWTDGWDPDTIRFASYQPFPDGEGRNLRDIEDKGPYRFGGVHRGGFNGLFADGSVHFLSFNIDRKLFNNLADRRDGAALDSSAISP